MDRKQRDMGTKNPAWSYSSLKKFQQCPKQYYHVRVLKNVIEPTTAAMTYGNRFHKAAELYVKEGKALGPEFEFATPTLDKLAGMKGTILPEQKMALNANLEPCKWRSNEAWWRGIADLLILNGERAKVLDYKTGKSTQYADKGQLELMALAVFKHYPDVKHVKAGLLFVLCNEFITEEYSIDDVPQLWNKWLSEYSILHKAYEVDTWNPKPSGLCKAHCPVTECIHNGRN